MILDKMILQQRELQKSLKEGYIEREIPFPRAGDLIKVIIGPRRAGKSTYAMHFLEKQGSFGYCNFDDEEMVRIKDYQEIITGLNSIYQNPKWLLFDEIQNLPRWELFVNRLQRQGFNLIITGSNSHLLSRELATHLTGRHLPIIVFPFSFREFAKRKNGPLITSEYQHLLASYLEKGGFPEPLVKDIDAKEYLATLCSSVIYKDIVKRKSIRSAQGMENLAQYLFSTVGNEFSHKALTKVTNLKSVTTTEKYAGYLEEAFLFFQVDRFSYKVREQIAFNKKVYSTDPGMLSAKSLGFSPAHGRMYENAVAISLKKKEMAGKLTFFFWKNPQQEEVDFVIKEGMKVTQLIQVCFHLQDEKTKAREIRALLKAGKELHCNNLLLITEGYEAIEEEEWFGTKGRIQYMPLWKWLLNN